MRSPIADNFIKAGQARTALVIGAETFSRILDWNDRGTCVLFGDGAGAVVLQAGEGKGTAADRGVLSTHLYSDGQLLQAALCRWRPVGDAHRRAICAWRAARSSATRWSRWARRSTPRSPPWASRGRDLDWLVPHQANRRIIDSMGQRLHLPPEKVVVTVDRHANTSAASIPLALAEAVGDGRIRPGHLVLLEAMGGGFTWGSALVRW